MSTHKCDAIVVCCMDFRFQRCIRDWIDENLGGKSYDLVGFAGATKELDVVMTQIDTSVKLHHVENVILMHHEDCGAYGEEDSYERHVEDLHKAKDRVLSSYPEVKVDLFYIHLNKEFEEIE